MKQLKDIQKKVEWEECYNPKFNWDDFTFYKRDNKLLSESFIREFKNDVNWYWISKYQ